MPTDVTTTDFPLPRRAGAYTFASLFAVESFVRSLNSTVISLQAYDILGAAQRVSMLSTVVSLSVLTSTLLLPFLLGRMRRRWTYTLGVSMMMAASLALASHVLAGQALGMLLRNLGAAVLNITLQLYIMEHIRRTDLARSEPIRLSLSTASWTIGPALGVTLYVSYGPWGPQLLAIAAAAVLMTLFWYLRLSDNVNAMPPGNLEGFSPLANVRRFLAQARLAHRLRALVLLDHLLHLWSAAAGRGRARQAGGRFHDFGQPDPAGDGLVRRAVC